MAFVGHNTTFGTDDDLQSDAFYPAVTTARFRAIQRADLVTNELELTQLLKIAIGRTNLELEQWKKKQSAAKLKDIESPQSLLVLYEEAVYSRTKALVLNTYRDQGSTGAVNAKAEDADTRADISNAEAYAAVRSILGLTRMNVALI